jgi:hypothetical protein
MSMGHEWNDPDEKAEVIGGKPVAVSFYLPQIPHELAWA